jgi:peptidoglycan/xylan/chitin deacetylase (PgdA/CDA1 family)
MTGGQSAILAYHSLDDSGSVISTPPALFKRQMEFLAQSGIPVKPLDEAMRQPGSLAITFDDGFGNLLDHAVPLLERLKLPATIFIVGAYCGGRNNWPSQPSHGIPDLPLLSWKNLEGLPGMVSLGAHTMTHPDLSRLPPEKYKWELSECQTQIEQRLGRAARWLAYPYGASSPEVRSAAREHFDLAVGTSMDFLRDRDDPLDLPRIDTYYLRDWFPLERLCTLQGNLYVHLRGLLRKARKVISG